MNNDKANMNNDKAIDLCKYCDDTYWDEDYSCSCCPCYKCSNIHSCTGQCLTETNS